MDETITWIDVRERLPEHMRDVLIAEQLGMPGTRSGYYTGKQWICSRSHFVRVPTHWAEMPTGPQPASQGRGGEDK